MTTSIVVGGSTGLGRAVAELFAGRGDTVHITSRDQDRAAAVAAEIGGDTHGLALDLTNPETIADALAGVDQVRNVVITAIEQSVNTLADFDLQAAVRVVTVKLVGYAEVVRALHPRMTPDAAVVLFGGLAKERPYPGSTMVTTFNAGVTGLTRTLAVELAPHRVNALHTGLVGDSPKWRDADNSAAVARTPIGRLITMAEVAHATDFLLTNGGVNAIDLPLDGGWLVR